MSRLLQKQQSYFFSSDPRSGALNLSPDGSDFTVQLDRPISLPKCLDATLEVTTASVWNVSPNVSALIGNNKLYIHTDYEPAALTRRVDATVPAPAVPLPTDFQILIVRY